MNKIIAIIIIAVAFAACSNDDNTKALSVSHKVVDVTTFGGNDGEISLEITGGKTPYTINWSNGESTSKITNLQEGSYTYSVTDATNLTYSSSATVSAPATLQGTISMGAGYVNNVYFNLDKGEVQQSERTKWDIAFETQKQSASIFTNDGNGVILYTYPKGTMEDWNSVDTAGLSSWQALYNNYKYDGWDFGAFNHFSNEEQFDYGWGKYNMSSHSVTGDSIYIIQLSDQSFKKLMIEKRPSSDNAYYFKYANLDGSNELSQTVITNNYLNKSFIQFSLVDNQVVDIEPNKDMWDIVFTKYVSMVYMGPTPVPYPVTGVLSKGIAVAKSESATENYEGLELNESISAIGSEWKSFNMDTYEYDVDTVSVYYIKKESQYYSLRFTSFNRTDGTVGLELIKL